MKHKLRAFESVSVPILGPDELTAANVSKSLLEFYHCV